MKKYLWEVKPGAPHIHASVIDPKMWK